MRVVSEIILDVRCLLCPGLIDRVARREVDEAVWAHWQRWHPATPTPVAGASYAVSPAPPVCDTCLILIERPWWEHVSTPPTPALGYADGDGRWLHIFSILVSGVSELRVCVLDMSVRQAGTMGKLVSSAAARLQVFPFGRPASLGVTWS